MCRVCSLTVSTVAGSALPPHILARITRPSDTRKSAQRGEGVTGDKRLPHEHSVGTRGAVVSDIRRGENRRLGNRDGPCRETLGKPAKQVTVKFEGREITGVNTDEGCPECRRARELPGGVRLDQRCHPELHSESVELAELRIVERCDDEQNKVSACRAGLKHLVRRANEVFPQYRQRNRSAHSFHVGKGVLELPPLGQGADCARPSELVLPGERDRVGNWRQIVVAGTAPFDLRN